MKAHFLAYFYLCFFISAILANGARSGDEYHRDKNIYELTPSNFDKVIQKSNYTSIVKFYAPWCGYCQKLKPIYKKLGEIMQRDGKYAVNVASVNCDKNYNKELCARYKISGFPTLLVFRPPKYDSNSKSKFSSDIYRHAVETYNGERSLSSIVSYLKARIKNYVKRFNNIKSPLFSDWINQEDNFKRVVLLKNAQKISSLYKTIAIDFLDTVKFAMVTVKNQNDLESNVLKINDSEVTLPVNSTDELPILLALDADKKTFQRPPASLDINNKEEISRWLMELFNVEPKEGTLSKKDKKFYSKYRSGKKRKSHNLHDEL